MIVELIEVRTGEVITLVPCLVPCKLLRGQYSEIIDPSTTPITMWLQREADDITPQRAAAIVSEYTGETWAVLAAKR